MTVDTEATFELNRQLDEVLTDLLDGTPPPTLANVGRVKSLFRSHFIAITAMSQGCDPTEILVSAMEVLFDVGFFTGRAFERRGYRLPELP